MSGRETRNGTLDGCVCHCTAVECAGLAGRAHRSDGTPSAASLFSSLPFPQLMMIDQRDLPARFDIVAHSKLSEVVHSIKIMLVRGAPAIGAAGGHTQMHTSTDADADAAACDRTALCRKSSGEEGPRVVVAC